MRALIAVALCAFGFTASAAEQGCEKLAWNLDLERYLLAHPEASPGAGLPVSRQLALWPAADAGLPKAPERTSRAEGAKAAHLSFTVPEAGLYRVTLSSEAWLDLIQADAYRRAQAFTGVRDCPGLRKSVRFQLDAGLAVVQISGSTADTIGVVVTQDR